MYQPLVLLIDEDHRNKADFLSEISQILWITMRQMQWHIQAKKDLPGVDIWNLDSYITAKLEDEELLFGI